MEHPTTTIELSKICGALQNLIEMTILNDENYLSNALKPILYKEFEMADSADTKSNIQQRVLRKTAKILGNVSIEKSGGGIVISKPIMVLFDKLYEQTKNNDVKMNVFNTKYSAFKGQNIHDILAVKNMVREFQKNVEIVNENSTNKREKILKNNHLGTILAVDGMQGLQPIHLVNYIHNLSIGNTGNNPHERHVTAVREIHKSLPSLLTGTDCAYYVTQLLLEIYLPSITDQNLQLIVKNEIENIENYLFKQAEHYTEIKTIKDKEFVAKMKETYCRAIADQNDLAKLANDKINKFVTYRNNRTDNKRKNELVETVIKPNKKTKQEK